MADHGRPAEIHTADKGGVQIKPYNRPVWWI